MRRSGEITGCVCSLLLAAAGFAQFDSGSDGTDGALSIAGGQGTVAFELGGLDPDGDRVFHFTMIDVGAGTTVDLTVEELGTKPVYFLASGDVNIEGTIRLNGEDGGLVTANPGRVPAKGGPGGFDGGVSSLNGSGNLSISGQGPGGGLATTVDSKGGGGGGYGSAGGRGGPSGTGASGGMSYGNTQIQPLIGGSGAGGGRSTSSVGDPGGGGGALLIASSGTVTITGGIEANGGTGNGTQASGGSGGAIRLVASTLTGTGSLRVEGGGAGTHGGFGGAGRIRLEAVTNSFSGTSVPEAIVSAPKPVFYPESAPRVKLVRVDGIDVAVDPTGSFVMPDVVINNAEEVTLEIEASNIPAGTVIELRLNGNEGEFQTLMSTPLAGTIESSTATAAATIPSGFSTFFLTASW